MKTWDSTWFDFMGVCDLVLVDAPRFDNGLGLTVQIRTKARYEYSYIETAAVKIGNEILEVSSYGAYILNGVDNAEMPSTLSGYSIVHAHDSELVNNFRIELRQGQSLVVQSFKGMVSVKFAEAQESDIGDSKGLMGSFPEGNKLARGCQIMVDDSKFGQEWQVNDADPKLFSATSGPQFPEACVFPSPTMDSRRRLRGVNISEEAAEAACAHKTVGREQCIYDVMATGDLDMAQAGAF